MSRPKMAEAAMLNKWSQAVYNAQRRPEIANLLKEYTYDISKMSEGAALMDETITISKKNQTETDEASAAYAIYEKNYDALVDLYKIDRKKAKTILRKDPVTLDRLLLTGSFPEPYIKLTASATKLYEEISSDKALQAKLAPVKISVPDATSRLKLINAVKDTRYNWNAERGQSEDATIAKDEAFAKMDDWMDDFYGIAKIALADHPQYLEALGLVVKR